WEIAYRLRSVPGVVEVNTWGGKAQQYHVVINPQSLIAYKLSLASVFEALEKNNANVGSGYMERNQEQYIIRGEALISSIRDIENIVVGHNREGVPVFVKNLGTVEKGSMLRIGAATEDGRRETVIGLVQMLAGANAREIVERVKVEAAKIQLSLPQGVAIRPFYDRAQFVDRVLRTVSVNLMEGGLLVIAVLFVLLGSFRGGLLVALAIPLSMLFAFIGMYYLGISGNLMSLGAIDFGLIVDGSVVMVENILRKRSANPEASILELTRQGGREVARPVFFAILIITLVYLPILALTGTEGKLFRPMAITVIFALLGSLIVAMTVVPVLASILLRKSPPTGGVAAGAKGAGLGGGVTEEPTPARKGAYPSQEGIERDSQTDIPRSTVTLTHSVKMQGAEHETWLVRVTRKRYIPVLQWTMEHRGATALL